MSDSARRARGQDARQGDGGEFSGGTVASLMNVVRRPPRDRSFRNEAR